MYVFSPDSTITALSGGTLQFTEDYVGTVSVFAATDVAKDVTLQGLKYPLEHATLTNRKALGVSNEFMGRPATISVAEGVLWIMWQESRECKLPERYNGKSNEV